ncbi:NYN domain-containing protein [Desulfonema ishimotonii]|uniref:NYN domain-containing protein n=1 Tax=Desulfonema ishimotonii TaxID=45657 RepID=A0A401G259_9BACT|nr:NYN domain-containing protein [Desulfonema ishimotonii]GBC63294.1 NYN domain-containing protein [Desulfonema ishimotonii]
MTTSSRLKIGVYVDVANLAMNGGFGMRYEVLRSFACRGGAEPIRLNAYVSYDNERARHDYEYRDGQHRFHSVLRDMGYKVIQKTVKWYTDDRGSQFGKANVDLELAIDALLQSENLDRVLLATGDGDFVQVVRALQNRGCRVEVVAFDNVSGDLRQEADLYISGYLIPNLLPITRADMAKTWGGVGSFARGICYAHDKDYGFLRYLNSFDSDLWKTDARDPDSPYSTIFFHDSELPHDIDSNSLPSRNIIFEFQIQENDQGKHRAVAINCIRTRT